MSCLEIFYVALPALHAIGALLAMGLSFGCDTGRAEQTARRPYALPNGLPGTTSFNTAFPWDEGFEFENHTWNPFALIFVFEWLTAGFALRPLQYYFDHTRLAQAWLIWISAGHLVFIAWTFTNSGGICPTMLAIVTASFFMSGVVCVYTLYYPSALDEQGDETPASEAKLLMRAADENYRDKDGRVWKIPRSITMLRRRFVGNDEEQDPQGDEQGEVYQAEAIEEYEDIQGVIFRYAEYCITAPLLFLAVLCLMVVEAPAWLFLTGYWLLVTCNAIGIALHASFVFSRSEEKPEGGGLAPFVFKFFFAGPWWVFVFILFFMMKQEKKTDQKKTGREGAGGILPSTSRACCRRPGCACWPRWAGSSS